MKQKKSDDFNRDTIAAIITPPGEGGIGAIRISGPEAPQIIKEIFRPSGQKTALHKPFHMYYGHIIDNNGDVIDEVTMVEMPQGKSYTGQKQAEIFCHGGQYVLKQILLEILRYKTRPAEPGEFTRRAFLAGRIDLTKAEAVADLIASKTEYSYNAAKKNLLGQLSDQIEKIRNYGVELLAEIEASVDYPDEDLETAEKDRLLETVDRMMIEVKELADSYRTGKIIREGFKVAITGRPNAGKSSLFNLLVNQSRAIVTATPGTTRDYLTEWIDLDGIAVSVTDTAGLRGAAGIVEKAGQRSAMRIVEDSDLVVWIVDIARKSWKKEIVEDVRQFPNEYDIFIVLNKIDKREYFSRRRKDRLPVRVQSRPAAWLSCKTLAGFKGFKRMLTDRINKNMPDLTDRLLVTSERHKKKLESFLKCLKKTRKGLRNSVSPELVAFDLRSGINEIDEITGRVYNEEILDRIFERFCIGK